jgi:hypothetical protein
MDPKLLLRWKFARRCVEEAGAELSAQIDALTAQLQAAIAPHMAELDAIEAEIKSAAIQEGAGFKAWGVAVSYRKGYERVTWDGKKLDGYAQAHPEIMPFRSVSQVAPSVSIKTEL